MLDFLFTLDHILRFFAIVFSMWGLFCTYKMFSLIRFTRYWSLAWGILGLTFLFIVFRGTYMLVLDIPCNDLALEYTAFFVSLGISSFICLMRRFFVKFLGITQCFTPLSQDKELDKVRVELNGKKTVKKASFVTKFRTKYKF